MIKKLIYFIIIIIVCLVIIELSLRGLGFKTYQIPTYSFTSTPKDCFQNSNKYGISLVPGKFEIDINNGLIHSVTHNIDSNRITSFNTIDSFDRKFFIFGCSYSYGTGINNQETYPFLLQSKLKHTQIRNFSVPAFGSVHALLQLQNQIEQNNIPDLVIIGFATFHEERNQMNKTYQYKLHKGMELNKNNFKSLIFPYKNLSKNKIEYINVIKEFKPFPLRKKLVISNLIEKNMLNFQSRKLNNLAYSKDILLDIKALCDKHNIKMIVADIDFKENSKIIKAFCSNKQIKYVNISPDFTKEGFRSLPYDHHPNKKAHNIYFEKMYSFLKSINFEN